MGEGGPVAALAVPASAEPLVEAGPARLPKDGMLKGVLAAPGLAIGKAVRLSSAEIIVREAGDGVAIEHAALTQALAKVRQRLETAASKGDKARKAILGAHLAFLEDPELAAGARALIDQGKSAGFAWRKAVGGYVDALRGLGDRRLAERVDDLVDLERQVLRALTGEEDSVAIMAAGSILLADELLPSQLMGVDPSLVAGFCTARGGPTSHVCHPGRSHGHPGLGRGGRRGDDLGRWDRPDPRRRRRPAARRAPTPRPWKPPRPSWPSARSARPAPGLRPTRPASRRTASASRCSAMWAR